MAAPNCLECVHRRPLPGDAHSRCVNPAANADASPAAIARGYFWWPLSFDPVWLRSCDGFSANQAGAKP
jgi:hypothetical protein